MYPGRRRLAVIVLAASLLAGPAAAEDAAAPLYQVFLTDGTALASYGEWARVRDAIVFSIPLGALADGDLQLVTLPAARVDWARTEQYRDRVRAAHYAATRGDAEFDALSGEVAQTLNALAMEPDPAVRLDRAERARRALAAWPAEHYGFKAGEVREMVGILDEIVGELRASAGLGRFELSLTAEPAAPAAAAAPLLAAPTEQAILRQLVTAASLGQTATERTSLFQRVLALLDRAAGVLPDAWAAELRASVRARLADDERVDRAYQALRTSAVADAARLAAAADVRGLERLRDRVAGRDAALEHQRPGEITALLATVDLNLDAARRLRLARDQWLVRSAAYASYQKAMKAPLDTLGAASASLESIRAMAGPRPQLLTRLLTRLHLDASRLAQVTPPAELAPIHAIIRSAWELAASAAELRLNAVRVNNLDGARQAAAAAAGALMLFDRARTDLRAALAPPTLAAQ